MDRRQALYGYRFSEEEFQIKDRIWKEIVTHALQKRVPQNASVLDIGCGRGEFLNHVAAAVRVGVDPIAAHKPWLDPAIEFHACEASDLSFLEASRFDLVFMSNLLEHLPDEKAVDGLLEACCRVLHPGGRVLVMGPNIRLIPGAYWNFWDHRVAISDFSLCEALQMAGFEIVESIGRFLPYTTKCRLPSASILVRLYLHLRVFWPLFGKQFLITAQRPRRDDADSD